jgi:hypothetical protein
MKQLLRTRNRLAAIGLLLAFSLIPAEAQSPPASAPQEAPVAIVHSVLPLSAPDGPAIEILSSRPIVPTIRKAENPPRIVIDLPNTRLGLRKNHVTFHNTGIEDVRLDQFQEYPPIARILIDVLQPLTYSWDATGNRLAIRLHSVPAPAAPVATVAHPTALPASAAVKEVTLDGNRVDAGSVTAGSDAAILQLGRGGQVRVCPKTTVSVTPSKNGRSVMFGMSTGAMEAHYTLNESADSIMTPDFHIQLVGPGEFDYAISTDSRGNTCVQALPGNTASVIVSELMGDGSYQVKPTEQVLFHSGQLKNAALSNLAGCGCPAPEHPQLLASVPESSPAKNTGGAASPQPSPTTLSTGPETAALPPSKPREIHVQVDAPFVFRGDEPETSAPPIVAIELLPLHSATAAEPVQAAVLAPPRKEHHGFFGKLRGFFAAVFS